MIFVPALASSAAKPVGDFLDRQMHHRLTLNKSSPQLMSAIAAKFDNQASRTQAPGFIRPEIKNLYPIKEPQNLSRASQSILDFRF
ncbi:hypothetical protein Osc7112_4036 [Oscillatoria nigro-viridis PCC 7112]|uniref:Uncharacterized protein n=1 Tax=Phormidium nigroviride PCC 7112 TaxID=179408 RepID=K9VLF2_9CYAN|nr:hypothetical protein [Oscillatoria nigro-viridis]AFZ08369.1 hypothetical protein Osc7112_4036 [Oscillatoria nigro-viridis PCC 7112]